MAIVQHRWRHRMLGLILGSLAGAIMFAVLAATGQGAGAVLRGLVFAGLEPALVERTAYEAAHEDLDELQRRLDRVQANRNRMRADLAQARQAVRRARAEREEVAEELQQAGLRIAAAVRTNDMLRKQLNGLAVQRRTAARKLGPASERIAQRTAKTALRNSLALPAEVIPFVGIATILAVTTLDLYDACSTVEDMNSIRDAVNLPPLDGVAGKTCGLVPDFRSSDCHEQVVALRAQGMIEDADELAAACEDG